MEDILEILILLAFAAGFIALLVILFKGLKCAARKNSMLELYEGYFTGFQAYIYLTLNVMRFVLPVIGVGYGFSPLIYGQGELDVGTLLIGTASGIVGGLLMHYLVRVRNKQLEEKYNAVAAKELRKAMMDVGLGTAFVFALVIIKEVTFHAANPRYVQTTDGDWVYVVYAGDGRYFDRHGNNYRAEEVHIL